jgi:hypothetical protein
MEAAVQALLALRQNVPTVPDVRREYLAKESARQRLRYRSKRLAKKTLTCKNSFKIAVCNNLVKAREKMRLIREANKARD